MCLLPLRHRRSVATWTPVLPPIALSPRRTAPTNRAMGHAGSARSNSPPNLNACQPKVPLTVVPEREQEPAWRSPRFVQHGANNRGLEHAVSCLPDGLDGFDERRPARSALADFPGSAAKDNRPDDQCASPDAQDRRTQSGAESGLSKAVRYAAAGRRQCSASASFSDEECTDRDGRAGRTGGDCAGAGRPVGLTARADANAPCAPCGKCRDGFTANTPCTPCIPC